jgi:hypothetical protein
MPPITSPPVTIPEDVAQFCAAHNITDDLHLAIRLAEASFAPVDRWQVGIEVDPETDDEYVVVDLWAALSVEEALKRDSGFSRRFVATATPKGMELVRLIPNLI